MNQELKLVSIRKSIGGTDVLNGVDISINTGETFALLGPSGCGKTTLLRITAGLEQADSGNVIFRGKSILEVPAYQRNFGMMFQDFALFPHKNVFDNIAFGLEMKNFHPKRIDRKVHELLELVRLDGYGTRGIEELSGGEKQRIALARTLAPEPDIILFDEPFGSLDRLLKERLVNDVKEILTTTGTTSIFVTHDHNEAFAVSDKLCVMDRGRVLQTGLPEDIYSCPATVEVADLLGFQNFIQGRLHDNGQFVTEIGTFYPGSGSPALSAGVAEQTLLMLPDCVRQVTDPSARPGINSLHGTLAAVYFQGNTKRIHVRLSSGHMFAFHVPRRFSLPPLTGDLTLDLDSSGLTVIAG